MGWRINIRYLDPSCNLDVVERGPQRRMLCAGAAQLNFFQLAAALLAQLIFIRANQSAPIFQNVCRYCHQIIIYQEVTSQPSKRQ